MRLAIKKNVIFEELGEEMVLLDLDGGTYYKLNGTGSRIWSLIGQHGDSDKVEQAIVAQYEVDPDRARREVAALVDDLEARGLVAVDRN